MTVIITIQNTTQSWVNHISMPGGQIFTFLGANESRPGHRGSILSRFRPFLDIGKPTCLWPVVTTSLFGTVFEILPLLTIKLELQAMYAF